MTAAAPEIEVACASHAGARAGWSCTSCRETLCPDCVGDKQLPNGQVTLCLHCGGLAKKLTRPRRIAPYWEMFPQFISAIFSTDGLIQLFAIGLFMYLLSWLPGFIGLVAIGFVWITYYFRVISHAAQGGTELPLPEDFLGFESVFPPLFRFVAATMSIWAPGAVYLLFIVGPSELLNRGASALLDPVLFVLVLGGLLYFPAAIIAAAVANSVLAVLNPLITVRMIFRIPGQYLLTWVLWAGLSVLDVIMNAGFKLGATFMPVPIVGDVLVRTLSLIVPVFTGLILGRLIYQNAEQFGLLGAGDEVEELWPEARPRGEVLPDTHSARLRPNTGPVEVQGWESDVAAAPAPGPDGLGAQPISDPSPWAPSEKPVDLSPIELDLDAGPELGGEGAPEVVHDTHAWLSEAGAGPGAPWSLGGDAPAPSPPAPTIETPPVVASPEVAPAPAAGPTPEGLEDSTIPVPGREWLDDPDAPGTEVDLEPLRFADGLTQDERPPATPAAPDLSGDLDLTPSVGLGSKPTASILASSQLGPHGELRPGSEPTPPAEPAPLAELEIASATPVLAGSRLHAPPGHHPELDPDESAALRAALEQGDVPQVLATFKARSEGRYPVLGPRLELRLAGIMEREAHYDEAVKACLRAVNEEPGGGFAPRALFMGARILLERLDDVARARPLLEHLVRTFPREQIADLARATLRKLP